MQELQDLVLSWLHESLVMGAGLVVAMVFVVIFVVIFVEILVLVHQFLYWMSL